MKSSLRSRQEPRRVSSGIIIGAMLLSLCVLSIVKARYCANPFVKVCRDHSIWVNPLLAERKFFIFHQMSFRPPKKGNQFRRQKEYHATSRWYTIKVIQHCRRSNKTPQRNRQRKKVLQGSTSLDGNNTPPPTDGTLSASFTTGGQAKNLLNETNKGTTEANSSQDGKNTPPPPLNETNKAKTVIHAINLEDPKGTPAPTDDIQSKPIGGSTAETKRKLDMSQIDRADNQGKQHKKQ